MPRLTLDNLKVRKGDPVQPFVEKLISGLPDLVRPYSTSPQVRFVTTAQGTNVVVDLEGAFIPPFKVRASQGLITVRRGLFQNEHVPTIKGVPVDGVKADGVAGPVPTIKLGEVKPNDNLRSWVHLQVRVTAEDELDLEAEDWLTVVHAATLEPPEEALGWQPLAMLVWRPDKATVARVHQITMHNLAHAYVRARGDARQPGRHFFWAV